MTTIQTHMRILTLEDSLSLSYKAKPQLTYDPKVILLGVNLTDLKHISMEKLAHRCLYHILFIITKNWNQ